MNARQGDLTSYAFPPQLGDTATSLALESEEPELQKFRSLTGARGRLHTCSELLRLMHTEADQIAEHAGEG